MFCKYRNILGNDLEWEDHRLLKLKKEVSVRVFTCFLLLWKIFESFRHQFKGGLEMKWMNSLISKELDINCVILKFLETDLQISLYRLAVFILRSSVLFVTSQRKNTREVHPTTSLTDLIQVGHLFTERDQNNSGTRFLINNKQGNCCQGEFCRQLETISDFVIKNDEI